VADFLDSKRHEINDRLAELRPLIDEYSKLGVAAKVLADVRSSESGAVAPAARPTATTRRGPGRPRGSKSKTAGARRTTKTATKSSTKPAAKRRVGRRTGTGQRGAQALALVTGQPGIAIPELAAKMGIKQNYLYRVLRAWSKKRRSARTVAAGIRLPSSPHPKVQTDHGHGL